VLGPTPRRRSELAGKGDPITKEGTTDSSSSSRSRRKEARRSAFSMEPPISSILAQSSAKLSKLVMIPGLQPSTCLEV